MQSPLLCARGCRAMFAASVPRSRACGHMRRHRIMCRRALGWANCGLGGPGRGSGGELGLVPS
eukprot:2510876-Prymnesium_polylepis.1